MKMTRVNQGIERPLSPAQIQAKRFCSRQCSAQPKRSQNRGRGCEYCETPIPQNLKACQYEKRRFCSPRCQYAAARVPRKIPVCARCQRQFDTDRPAAPPRYCSPECRAPSFHATRWQMPPEMRARFSERRQGPGNPMWQGGPSNALALRHRAFAAWGQKRLPHRCEQCGRNHGRMEMHHIVSKRRFQRAELAHFAQNLAVLCCRCHRTADAAARRAIREQNESAYPFGDRLPHAILRELIRDGLVSRLSPECDWSPLGKSPDGVPAMRAVGRR